MREDGEHEKWCYGHSGVGGVFDESMCDCTGVLKDRPDWSGWHRTEFASIWKGPDIELIVVQSNGPSESWQWTARGWREPDDCDGADNWGWCEVSTRKGAENTALRFYLEKDE